MITELEQRLADVLSARLPPPFGGRVFAALSAAPAGGPRIVVAVRKGDRVEPDLGAARLERTPGASGTRRVVRLSCTIELEVEADATGGRAQQLVGVDAALFALDDAELRSGDALRTAADTGFQVETRLVGVELGERPRITLGAEGWFWPVGAEGVTGEPIGEIRVRAAVLPIQVALSSAPVAGGPAVEVTITIGVAGRPRLADGPPLPHLPFGRLAVRVVDAGERPGAGIVSGGIVGDDGSTLVDLGDGVARVTYTPPATAVTDHLVIALDDGEDGSGIELGRHRLRVRPA